MSSAVTQRGSRHKERARASWVIEGTKLPNAANHTDSFKPCLTGHKLASLPHRVTARDAELQKRRTKSESKCSREQNTPPHKSEAGTLTNICGGSCIGYLTKRGRFTRKRQRRLQDYIGLACRSIQIFPKNPRQSAFNLDHPILRIVIAISGNSLSANQAECSRFDRLLLGLAVFVRFPAAC